MCQQLHASVQLVEVAVLGKPGETRCISHAEIDTPTFVVGSRLEVVDHDLIRHAAAAQLIELLRGDDLDDRIVRRRALAPDVIGERQRERALLRSPWLNAHRRAQVGRRSSPVRDHRANRDEGEHRHGQHSSTS